MKGHVAKKGSRHYAVVYEGFDGITGRDRYRGYAAGETRKTAEKMLTKLIMRVHDGDYRAPDRITVADYLVERWLRRRRRSCGTRPIARTPRTSSCTSTRASGTSACRSSSPRISTPCTPSC